MWFTKKPSKAVIV